MEVSSVLGWLLFQLLICETIQDGTFTSISSITKVVVSTDVAVTCTLVEEFTPWTSLLALSVSSPIYTTIIPDPIHTGDLQRIVTSQRESSNSSCSDFEASQGSIGFDVRASCSQNTTDVEVSFQALIVANSSFELPEQLQPAPTEAEAGSSSSEDQPAPGNDTRQDFSARWIVHQRKSYGKKRKLWTPDDDDPRRSKRASPLPRAGIAALAAGALYVTSLEADRRRRQRSPEPAGTPPPEPSEPYNILIQPDTEHVSREQLIAEVKSIYAGLVIVEAKCIEVDKQTEASTNVEHPTIIENEQWQPLIALHRCLLHEHHDFLLASQHPSASPALRRLASKYAMPARMWRHGIHSFLELLRHHLPYSYDHMLTFIYIAYQMMALLYETVPAFEDTWIECLGDLARYRMAIEDEDIGDRKVWTDVAHYWYSKASQRAPAIGRLYHHRAIMIREDVLQKFFFFAKSLTVAVPFSQTRTLIPTVLNSILTAESTNVFLDCQLSDLERAFLATHELLFNQELDRFKDQSQKLLAIINNNADGAADILLEHSHHIAIASSAAMLGYGSNDNPIMLRMKDGTEDFVSFNGEVPCDPHFEAARRMAHTTINAFLLRVHDPNVLAGIHAYLVFMHDMISHPLTAHLAQIDFPWTSLAHFANNLLRDYDMSCGIIDKEDFPFTKEMCSRPLPEDFAMRGLTWAEKYFTDGWFADDTEDMPQIVVTPRWTAHRKERVLWLAVRIARKIPSCLKYEAASFNPICGEFNVPQFSTPQSQPAFSCKFTLNKTELCDTSSHVRKSTSDSDLDGIHATLGLPMDLLEQPPTYAAGPVSPNISSKNSQETLEGWLSDFINLDMAFDENSDLWECHDLASTQFNTQGGKCIPDICRTSATEVIVFSQNDDGFRREEKKDPNRNSGSDRDADREYDEEDDRENMPETEEKGLVTLPARSEWHDVTPPLSGSEEYVPIEPKPAFIDQSSRQDKSEAKESLPQLLSPLSSSSSSPGKVHVCCHCNKAFSRASDMNKHIKYHTRPITCSIKGCDYTCGRQKDLSRHQHGVHKEIYGEEEFPCPYEECKKAGVTFSRRDNLGRHLKQKHGDAKGEKDEQDDKRHQW